MRNTAPARVNMFHHLRRAGFSFAIVALLGSGQPPHGFGFAAESGRASSHRSVYRTTSLYGTLEVTEADRVRYLFVDGVLQTAMYADPHEVAKECHLFSKHYWLELLPYGRPQARRCLLIGLGGGLLPAILAGYGVETHAVEIDPKVVEVARAYFGYRQAATVADGREFLARLSERYDFIVIDAFAGAEFPSRLASKECFELAKKKLGESGVLALNLVSRPAGSPVGASVVRTFKAVFPHVVVYRTDSPERIQPLVCFAARKPLHLTLHPHGAELGVTAPQLAEVARFKVAPASPEAILLTDDHNPLDRQWSQEAAQWRKRMKDLFGRR
jgi:spermidine synthase